MTFDAQLRTTLSAIHARPTPDEARAILDVARLAAAADKRTDVGETVVLLALSRIVCEMAGLSEIPPHTAIDAARLATIGDLLVPAGARELAFACAFLVMVQDLEITVEEGRMASALADALVLEHARAGQLATSIEDLVRAARG